MVGSYVMAAFAPHLGWSVFCDIQIPPPDIDIQQEQF
jgi:hypothetical protein